MDILAWILGILGFLVVLVISIGLHEAGHMSVAKLFKLSVPKFFVGFGKTLWSYKTEKTEYGIKAIPLGGFVRIEDTSADKESIDRFMLTNVKPWKRNLIFVAGPAVNILLGTLILIVMMMIFPMFVTGNTVDSVNERSSAMEAGLVSGDVITSIDGNPVENRDQIVTHLIGQETADVTVERDGEMLTTTVALQDGSLGVMLEAEEHYRSFPESLVTIGDLYMVNMEAIASLPSKVPMLIDTLTGAERNPEQPASVIKVGHTYGETAADATIPLESKVERFMMYSGLLNIGLGVANLLPFMPLDGGRILIAFLDSCKMHWSKLVRKPYEPVSKNMIEAMTIVTGITVVGFMLLLFLTDIALVSRGAL